MNCRTLLVGWQRSSKPRRLGCMALQRRICMLADSHATQCMSTATQCVCAAFRRIVEHSEPTRQHWSTDANAFNSCTLECTCLGAKAAVLQYVVLPLCCCPTTHRVLVHIHLQENSFGVLFTELDKYWPNHLAGAAPVQAVTSQQQYWSAIMVKHGARQSSASSCR